LISYSGIVLATSIAPTDIRNQRNAVDTWLKSGFHVVSLNCKEELQKIICFFPEVEFIEVDRDGREMYGRPYVYLNDFMEFFQKSQYKTCGIINSDIHLIGIGEDFKEFLDNQTENSLVFGHRIDIKSLDGLYGKLYIGHDYFFFDRTFACLYPDEGFCIGQPAWDYWMPFLPLLYGKSVKKLLSPIAYHIKHPQNWLTEIDMRFKNLMANKYLDDSLYVKRYDDIGHIRIQSVIEKNMQEIVYTRGETKLRVLIVYDNNGESPEKSETLKSIQNQTYSSISIIESKKDAINVQDIKEDLVYFIREGTIINKFFIELMANYINDKKYIVCGIRLKNSDDLFVDNIYPIDLKTGILDIKRLNEGCLVYRKEILQESNYNGYGLLNHEMSFMAQGLVEMKYNEYIMKQLEVVKQERLYIYAAGGHTRNLFKQVDFSKYNLCGIIDKNKELDGSKIDGYPVYHIDSILSLDAQWILISSSSFETEIYDELSKIIDERKLIRIYYN